jgi:hypothetical protein
MTLGSITARNQSIAGTYGDDKGATAPTSVMFRLYVGDPAGAGVEVSGNAYAPVTVANTTANVGTPAGGQLGPVVVDFPEATGAGWGTPDQWAATDTSGNIYDYGPILQPIAVPGGIVYRLAATIVAS